MLVVEGKMTKDDYAGGLRVTAEKLMTLAEARNRYARKLVLTMNGGSDAKRLQNLLKPFSNGPCPVPVRYNNAGAITEIDLPEQ